MKPNYYLPLDSREKVDCLIMQNWKEVYRTSSLPVSLLFQEKELFNLLIQDCESTYLVGRDYRKGLSETTEMEYLPGSGRTRKELGTWSFKAIKPEALKQWVNWEHWGRSVMKREPIL